MTYYRFALFDTAIGRCGIAWSERGIAAVQLPEPSTARTRARLLQRFPEAQERPPSAAVKSAIERIVALLDGKPADLSGVALDMQGVPPFHRRVYEAARAIPAGSTRSYAEIAARAGRPGAARAAGQALARNPFPIVVPCHRVLAASGKGGGFSAWGGVRTKLRILAIEGAGAQAPQKRRVSSATRA